MNLHSAKDAHSVRLSAALKGRAAQALRRPATTLLSTLHIRHNPSLFAG
jgi:hypothetical protein